MTPALPENDGSRPSRLALARYATGEGSEVERAEIAAWLADHPEGQAYLDGLEAARAEVAPFDAAALRQRAGRLPGEAPRVPTPANKPFALRWVIPLAAAALALFVFNTWETTTPADLATDGPAIRLKGDAALRLYTLSAGILIAWDGAPLGEGDVVGFRVGGADLATLTLLSIDGLGQATLFHPAPGAPDLPAGPGADLELPFTVTLDDAPGPEVFVAAFGLPPAQARADALAAWSSGGADALAAWSEAVGAATVVVEKR